MARLLASELGIEVIRWGEEGMEGGRRRGMRKLGREDESGANRPNMVNRSIFDIALGGITDTLRRRRDSFFRSAIVLQAACSCSWLTGAWQRSIHVDGQDDPLGVRRKVLRTRALRDAGVTERGGPANRGQCRRDQRGLCEGGRASFDDPRGGARGAAAGTAADVVVTDAIEADMMVLRHAGLCTGNKTFTREGKAIMYADAQKLAATDLQLGSRAETLP
eukprot:762700-Hanusia_phi.AAC.3